ncbi:MAG: LPS export ABC transporter ATP-binding protein [Pirellula sp.]|jgi:lipopolysaccharide export system ATP-binding protein|nr:LPS export ABC transporter ATP-binding protein [Pirellula sp.]
MDVLRVENLEKTFGRRKVVQGVSFRVAAGEIVGLLGPNGAGKSTSFKMTCGLVQPDNGKVFLGPDDVTRWPMFLRARDGGMGYLAQEPSVFKKLSVEQNISAILEMLGHSWRDRSKRTDELLELLNIKHIRTSKAGTLSGGERRRLEIARCLVSNPKIIMLDEPYAGVDPVTVQSMRPIIHQLRAAGISVLITDHDAQEILKSVNRCYVIDEGKVFCEGDPDTVRKDPQVRKKYLGELADLEIVSTAHQRVDHPRETASTVPAPKKGLFDRLIPRRRSP